MSDRRITCAESNAIRPDLKPWASCTNFIDGKVLNIQGPPHTLTEWCNDDEVVVLVDVLDADGCRHTLRSKETDNG